ncbi:glycerophosphodiester phosphodiesterase family protein [Paenibacillus oryzisoli]|uniref:glycerophosphodiester phosphodiesterase family protein n=1 Tax=Paenibacillus oryzisoli TaxID=1850517 RepID=UPI003D2BC996
MIQKLEQSQSLVIAGHRGFKSAYPENTLLSFKEALALGVGMLEFDLRLTKDGVVVVLHDETVDRTTNGTGPVGEYTLDELQNLDAGGWFDKAYAGLQVPTLDELCELLSDYPELLLNVEIKPSRTAREVTDQAIMTLEKFGHLSRCVFTSFDAAVLDYLYDAYGAKTQGFEAGAMSNFDHSENGTYSKMWAIAFPMKALTAEKVRAAQQKGLLAWGYCPDTAEEVAYAKSCGVTLVTCNDPRPALEAAGQLVK